MITKADAIGAGNAYAALDAAISSGDVAGIISGVAGVIAALPGPQQTGMGIAATGLSAMTAGAHASNNALTPSDVAGVASGILGIISAGAAAGLIAATAPKIAAAAAIAAAYSFLTTPAFDAFVEYIHAKLASGATLSWSDLFPGPNLTIPRDRRINDNFKAARVNPSPLVFDLDGDGIEINQLSGNAPVLFDHDADGLRTGTAWVKSDDALLVLDRDGNGTIDSGRELFGDNTLLGNGQKAADGYAALRELDSNHDGQIDNRDTRYSDLHKFSGDLGAMGWKGTERRSRRRRARYRWGAHGQRVGRQPAQSWQHSGLLIKRKMSLTSLFKDTGFILMRG